MFIKTTSLLTLLLTLTFVYAHLDPTSPIPCNHGKEKQPEPLFMDVQEDMTAAGENNENGRTLASYPNIRIVADYNRLSDASAAYASYVKNKLVPPILSYFQDTLKVKYPVSGTLKLSSSTNSICGGATPKALLTGVATDLYYILDSNKYGSTGTIATSYACYLATGTNRPLVVTTMLNQDLLVNTDDVLLHERNMVCTMHELIHTLGFTSALYPLFLDANGQKLTGHIKSATLDGKTVTVLAMPPLLSRVQSYFGCSSIAGAYLENDGGTGTAGVHFEKRHMPFEAMSSGLIYQMAVSQFTLAFLEGTGWYVPDYTNADPMWFGQGQGCGFLTKSCSSSTFNYDDFCDSSSDTTADCTSMGRGGGVCTSDALTNGCEFYHPFIGYDCENTDSTDYARLPNIQTFGRGLGSKCFSGTLSSTSSSSSKTTFCFKYTCSGSGSTTKLTVNVGSTSVACTSKGAKTVAGYKGAINCPDPIDFCSTVGLKVCPRGCMGRGTCVNGICKCNSGFSGKDCALTA